MFLKDKPFVFPDQPARGITHWDWSLTPLKHAGKVTGVVFSMRETTPYKRAAQELAKSQAKNAFLGNLVRRSSQPLATGFGDGRIGYINQAFADLTGYTIDELRELNWRATLTPPNITRWKTPGLPR